MRKISVARDEEETTASSPWPLLKKAKKENKKEREKKLCRVRDMTELETLTKSEEEILRKVEVS